MNRKSNFLIAAVGCLATLILQSCASRGGAGETPPEMVRKSVPDISRLAGVQIGYSTQEDLARRWGGGEVVTGGHPNSGRVWRVKGTSWVVSTDGFDYSQRGLVVDGLMLADASQQEQSAPFARVSKADFYWFGGIAPGMWRSDVEKFLRSKSLVFIKTDPGLAVRAKGHHALVNSTLANWTVRFDFTTNRLSRLSIDAGP